MKYQLLGKSGLRVSELCLGTMTYGEEWGWGANKDESKAVFDAYVDAGGNFLDTADGYTGGTSEKFVGEFIQGRRDQFVIATKFSFNQRRGDPNAGGNHRKNMAQALEGSLKRLGTERNEAIARTVVKIAKAAGKSPRAGGATGCGRGPTPSRSSGRGNFHNWKTI